MVERGLDGSGRVIPIQLDEFALAVTPVVGVSTSTTTTTTITGIVVVADIVSLLFVRRHDSFEEFGRLPAPGKCPSQYRRIGVIEEGHVLYHPLGRGPRMIVSVFLVLL